MAKAMYVHYVSGSRADFGLMERCLQTLHTAPQHTLGLILSGQHTAPQHAKAAADVKASWLPILHQIPVHLTGLGGAEMGLALADELRGFIEYWEKDRPDLVLVLGDRGEMVAAALAAVHLGIHIAHIHGGERSGTLDESFRHVISKLSHIHLPATEDAARRLLQMGENPNQIHVIGAPGLVGLTDRIIPNRKQVAERYGFRSDHPIALCVFHPVVQEAEDVGMQMEIVLKALMENDMQAVVFRPNSDAGGQAIDRVITARRQSGKIAVVRHLERDQYLRTLASCDIMIGNSSSGIIESASFDVACINLGSRQNDRLRNPNTVDCPIITVPKIKQSIAQAQGLRPPFVNLYGDGKTDRKLCGVLDNINLNKELLSKRNTY